MPHTTPRATTALAVFAAIQALHQALHPLCDHIVQSSADAAAKGLGGPDAAPDARRRARAACARHVASYTTVQITALTAVTRVLGARLSWRAVAAAAVVNAVSHYVIDLRWPLRRFLDWAGKAGYVAHATVTRRDGVVEETGPGTALYECDQAAHHACSAVASALAAWIATRRM